MHELGHANNYDEKKQVIEEARQEERDRLANAAKWLVLIVFSFFFFLAFCSQQKERERLAKAARLFSPFLHLLFAFFIGGKRSVRCSI